MRKLIPLLGLVLIGCSRGSGPNPDPIEVSGTVQLAGKPVTDVVLNLQPTGTGGQAAIPVKNGEFHGSVIPGRYTWYFTETKNLTAYRAIPEKYRAGSMDRQIDISSGAKLTLSMD
jgi:hypothetical protein